MSFALTKFLLEPYYFTNCSGLEAVLITSKADNIFYLKLFPAVHYIFFALKDLLSVENLVISKKGCRFHGKFATIKID